MQHAQCNATASYYNAITYIIIYDYTVIIQQQIITVLRGYIQFIVRPCCIVYCIFTALGINYIPKSTINRNF